MDRLEEKFRSHSTAGRLEMQAARGFLDTRQLELERTVLGLLDEIGDVSSVGLPEIRDFSRQQEEFMRPRRPRRRRDRERTMGRGTPACRACGADLSDNDPRDMDTDSEAEQQDSESSISIGTEDRSGSSAYQGNRSQTPTSGGTADTFAFE